MASWSPNYGHVAVRFLIGFKTRDKGGHTETHNRVSRHLKGQIPWTFEACQAR